MSTHDELFGELRSLIEVPYGKHFKALIDLLVGSELEVQVLAEEVVPYVQERLEQWPVYAPRRLEEGQVEAAVKACERGVPLYRLVFPLDLRLLGEAFREEHLPREFGMGCNDIAATRDALTHTYGIKPRDVEVNGAQFASFFRVWESSYREKFYMHHGNVRILGDMLRMNWSTLITITGDVEFEKDGGLGDLQMGVGGDLISRDLYIDAPMCVEGAIRVRHAWINDYDPMLEGNVLEAEVGICMNASFKDTSRVKLPIDLYDETSDQMNTMNQVLAPEIIEHMNAYIEANREGDDPDDELEQMYKWLQQVLPKLMDERDIWAK